MTSPQTATDVALIENITSEVFTVDGKLDEVIATITEKAKAFEPDLTTDKSRKEIASMAYKVARSKTALDEVGDELSKGFKDRAKAIDAKRKDMKEKLDALRDSVRAPLTDWEINDKERKVKLERRLTAFDTSHISPSNSSAQIETAIAAIEAEVVDDSWDEFKERAHEARTNALLRLKDDVLPAARHREANEAELAALRKEKAEREAREAKEREEAAKKAAEEAQAAAAEANPTPAPTPDATTHEPTQADKTESEATTAPEPIGQYPRASGPVPSHATQMINEIRADMLKAMRELKPETYTQIIDALITGKIPHVKVVRTRVAA